MISSAQQTSQIFWTPKRLSILFILLLCVVALCVVLLFDWVINDVQDEANKIAGLGLLATIVSSSAGAVWTVLEKRNGAQITLKNRQISDSEDELLKAQVTKLLSALKLMGKSLSDEDILNLLTDSQREQAQDYLNKVREIETYFSLCQEISLNLGSDQFDERLQEIAQTVTDDFLDSQDKIYLESLNLTNEGSNRHPLYEDIYLYLKVWLQNSIEYDVCMPDIDRQIQQRNIYTSIIETMRNQKYLDMFPVSGVECQDIIRKFLGVLTDMLEKS